MCGTNYIYLPSRYGKVQATRVRYRPRVTMVILLGLCLFLSACATYAGHEEFVLLDVRLQGPEDTRAFLVPELDWLRTAVGDDGESLERYYVGTAPHERITLRAGTYRLIWHCEGAQRLERVTLSRTNAILRMRC